jgi:NitT/TauT family transport system substrate-binding protein
MDSIFLRFNRWRRPALLALVVALALTACGSPGASPSPGAGSSASAPARSISAAPAASQAPIAAASSGAQPAASTAQTTAKFAGGDPNGDEIKISYASPALSGLPFYAALSEGFFAQQHLNVTMLKLPSTAAITALSKGEIQFMDSPTGAMQGATRGLPLKVVLSLWQESPWALVGKTELKSIDDLRGKVVGTSAVGNTPYLYLEAALKKAGMDITSDVKIISTRGTEDSYAFLIGGKVDAVVISPPYDAKAEAQGFHEVAFLGDALDLPYIGLGTTTAFIDQHHDQVVRMIRALIHANHWLQSHGAEAARLTETYLGVSPAIAKTSTDKLLPLLSTDGELSVKSAQEEIDIQQRFTHATSAVPAGDMIDLAPLHEALK